MRIVKQYPFYVVGMIVAMFFLVPVAIDLSRVYGNIVNHYAPYLIFVYGVVKLFQNNPIINVPFQIFQYRLFDFKKFKRYLLMKMIFPSIVFLIVYMLFMQQVSISLIIALLANVLFNYLCFMRYQYEILYVQLLMMSTVVLGFIAIYVKAIIIPALMFVAMIIHLFSLKSLDYSLLHRYYQIMSKMGEGLLNKDISKILEIQQLLTTKKVSSNTKLLLKYYDQDYSFYFMREALKIRYYQKDFFAYVTTLLLFSMAGIWLDHFYYEVVYIFLVIFFTDHMLTKLNKYELETMKKSLVFHINLRQYVKRKYICHLIFMLVPIILSFSILIKLPLSFLLIWGCLPLKNVLFNYTEKKFFRAMLYALGGVLYSFPYIEMTWLH
ncbi:hypothetical protein [Anoxybacillus tengchongensis]|nr:hypothetical protein [Anoxybacillus tengchongensis]